MRAVSSGSVTVNADSSVQLLAEEAVPLDQLDVAVSIMSASLHSHIYWNGICTNVGLCYHIYHEIVRICQLYFTIQFIPARLLSFFNESGCIKPLLAMLQIN